VPNIRYGSWMTAERHCQAEGYRDYISMHPNSLLRMSGATLATVVGTTKEGMGHVT
jgi:hypothetical protein